MPDFKADRLIGKTLIANQPIAIKRLPSPTATTVFIVPTGQPVGVVDSYLSPAPGRSNLFWMFYDSYNKPYYTEHLPGMYNVNSLVNQGVQTTLQKIQAEQKENESLKDTAVNTIKYLFGFGVVAYLAATFIKTKAGKK